MWQETDKKPREIPSPLLSLRWYISIHMMMDLCNEGDHPEGNGKRDDAEGREDN